jgi:hypothetical protein
MTPRPPAASAAGESALTLRRCCARRPASAAAHRRSAAVAATRRRPAAVARSSPALGPGASLGRDHDRGSWQCCRCCPARAVGARRVVVVSRNRCGVITSECPRRLPVIDQTLLRPTRHPVQTPARRCRGGVRLADAAIGSRAGAWTRCIPAATRLRRAQVDVAGTLSEGRLDDSAIPTSVRRAPTGCAGHPREPCNDRRSW